MEEEEEEGTLASSLEFKRHPMTWRATSGRPYALDVWADDEDDREADYSGNLCLFLDSASEADWVKWLPTGLFTVRRCKLKSSNSALKAPGSSA
jgi:hypothetical protein